MKNHDSPENLTSYWKTNVSLHFSLLCMIDQLFIDLIVTKYWQCDKVKCQLRVQQYTTETLLDVYVCEISMRFAAVTKSRRCARSSTGTELADAILYCACNCIAVQAISIHAGNSRVGGFQPLAPGWPPWSVACPVRSICL